MTPDPQLQALYEDVEAIRQRLNEQRLQDPDHEVAIAMFEADYRRAAYRLSAYKASLPTQHRAYIDGRRVA